jgi:hypothetical protein
MLCLRLITRQRRALCDHCDAVIDLRLGGLWPFNGEGRPVCHRCAADNAPEVALAGALYGQMAGAWNATHPDNPFQIALLPVLDDLVARLNENAERATREQEQRPKSELEPA